MTKEKSTEDQLDTVFEQLRNALREQMSLSKREDETKKLKQINRTEILRLKGELQALTRECLKIE